MDLKNIIERLLTPNNDEVQKATKELENAISRPETIVELCNIMACDNRVECRQCAAVLLKKHLCKLRNYQQLPSEIRLHIKTHIVKSIFDEKENSVRGSMAQFLGVLLRHESQTNDVWVDEVIRFILDNCCSTEVERVEIGSFVFAKLADITPEVFIQRFGTVKIIFQKALFSLDENLTNMSPSILYNWLTAMEALVPVVLGNTEAEETYAAAIPHLVNIINKFAAGREMAHYSIAFDVLQNMSECLPSTLNQHIRLLMEFAFSLSSNATYDPEIRINALNYVCFIVGEKSKFLVKLKMIEPILNVVFNIMASEPESEDADEFFVESETVTPLAAATIVIDTMATKIAPEKFIQPLLRLLEPALNSSTDDLRRRAAYIVLGTISEGCRDAISDKYMEPMLNILKQGLNDPVPSVRNAALFAVGQFSEQLQPEIADYANDVLPLLLKYMQDILQAHEMGQQFESKTVERVFYALEAFCDSMEENLAPYMENLMFMVLTLLSNDYPQRLKIVAMALCEAAGKAYKGSLLPWFQQLIEKLRPLLLLDEKSDGDELRSQAINTLAAIARNIHKEFLPFARETMDQCVVWIESSDDIDVRRSLINLFGALASVVENGMAYIMPKVLEHIYRCIEEGTDLPPNLTGTHKDGGGDSVKNNEDDEIDLDDTSGEGSVDEEEFFGENPYLKAKDQAIQTITEIVESCMEIVLPYAQKLFETLYKMIDHCYDNIRKSSIAGAKSLTIEWIKIQPDENAKQALQILLPKLVGIVHKDSQSSVVIEALESIGDLLSELKYNSLPNKQMRDAIAQCIKDGLTYKYMCLFCGETPGEDSQDEGDCESDIAVIEGAANLLPSLGKAVPPEEFAEYFKSFEPLIFKHMNNTAESEIQIERGYLIGVLAECYAALGTNVAPYFSKHFNVMIRAMKQRNSKTRQNAVFGLGELVRAGKDISYSYFPNILENLFQALMNEKKRVVLDNIIGAFARLLLTNATLAPVGQIMPVILEKLPIEDDKVESIVVIECFNLLLNEMPQSIESFIVPIVTVTFQSIAKTQNENDVIQCAVKLIQNIRTFYPDHYQHAMGNPVLKELIPLVQEHFDWQL